MPSEDELKKAQDMLKDPEIRKFLDSIPEAPRSNPFIPKPEQRFDPPKKGSYAPE